MTHTGDYHAWRVLRLDVSRCFQDHFLCTDRAAESHLDARPRRNLTKPRQRSSPSTGTRIPNCRPTVGYNSGLDFSSGCSSQPSPASGKSIALPRSGLRCDLVVALLRLEPFV